MSDKKKINKKVLIGCIAGVVLTMSAIIAIIFAVKNLRSATTMRLMRFTGTVTLTGPSGNNLEPSADKRLTNGNTLGTQTESQAWVLLDEDRVVTLMQESRASFTQKGKKLTLNLEEGRLFFNIDRSLADDETFDIQTSTMVIGIRGTSGYVDSDENGNAVIYLTTGKVEVEGLDDDGEEFDSAKIKPGQKLTVDSDNETITVEDVTEYDLPSEMIYAITEDDDLLEKILDETDWDEDLLELLADLYEQGYDISEILEMGLASADDGGAGDNSVADYTFDVNELTGTWFGDGENFISLYGDGTGLLMYRAYNPVHPEDNSNFIPFTMTYELSEDYLIFKDSVNFPDGVICNYFMLNDKLVLYDSYHDRLLVKDNSFTVPDNWRDNHDMHPAKLEIDN